MEIKKTRSSIDTAMNDVVSVIKAGIRASSDIVYTRDGVEFKVILPYADGSAHHVPLKRLRDRLSEVVPELSGFGLRRSFDIDVAGVNVLLPEAEFAYMDEADKIRYAAIKKTGGRFAVFHGKVSFAEDDVCA